VRPRKIILCVDYNEQDLSLLSYLLHIRGYFVMGTGSAEEAIRIYRECAVDLVITVFVLPGQMDGDQLIRQLKRIRPHIPMILHANPKQVPPAMIVAADAFLDKKRTSAEELVGRVRIMSARKRGPRKGTPSPRKVTPVGVASHSQQVVA